MRNSKPLLLFFILLLMSSFACGKASSANNVYEDGVTLTITSKPFNPKAHIVIKCGETVCVIDGKPVYGTYGKMPKQEVTSLVFEKNGKKIALDVSAMYNPNVSNSNIKQYVKITSWGEGTYEVTGYFSHNDGDDSMYICRWLIMQGRGSIRNHMSDYESLVSLTTKVQEDFNLPNTTDSK